MSSAWTFAEIISRFERNGYKSTGLKWFYCTNHHNCSFFQAIFPIIKCLHYSQSCCLFGPGGVLAFLPGCKLIGATNIMLCQIHSEEIWQWLFRLEGLKWRDMVHGSDCPENGKREIGLLFKVELCEWASVQEFWLVYYNPL